MAENDYDREERLALQAGEDAIFDRKSSVHGVIVGPHHQLFCDMIDGKVVLPEPPWVQRSKDRQAGLKKGTVK